MRRILLLLAIASPAAAQPDPEPPPDPAPTAMPDPASPPTPTPTPVQPPPVAAAPTQPAPEPVPTEEERIRRANYEPASVRLGGFLQPQYRWKQDSDVGSDTNGFRAKLFRLVAQAETRSGNLELSATVEAELQPQFTLQDAYATASRPFKDHARVTVDFGQMRVPVSRQNLLSDSWLSFADKAQLASISPGRDLGARVTLDLPHPTRERRLPGVRIYGGVFNGEGINQIENINQRYLWAGRMEVTLLGHERGYAESAFGGHFLTLSGSGAVNHRTESGRTDKQTTLGFDVAGAYRGLSGEFEYLEVRHAQTVGGMPDPNTADFHANGVNAQLCYLLPLALAPYKQSRIELGMRFEEIDRNDTIPIAAPGDPNQSVRAITAVATYYLRMHNVKAQLAFTHFKEIEDRTQSDGNASFDNDQLLLQVTYRLE